MITEIYKDAIENRKKAESLQDLIDFEAEENFEYSYNLHRDTNFLYKLSKIFYYIINTGDRVNLSVLVSHYEDKLSVPAGKRIIKKEERGVIGQIIQKVSDAAAQKGINIGITPETIPNIDSKTILSFVDLFLNNEATSKLLDVASGAFKNNDMMNNFNNIKNEFVNNDGSMNFGSIKNIITSVSSGDLRPIKEMSEKMNLGSIVNDMNLGSMEGMEDFGKDFGKSLGDMVSGDFDFSKIGDMIPGDFDLSKIGGMIPGDFDLSKIGDMVNNGFKKSE